MLKALKRGWNGRRKGMRFLGYLLNLVRNSRSLPDRPVKKTVFVHLDTQLRYRFVEQILRTLRAAGYTIYYYVSSVKDLMILARLDGDLFWTPGVIITAALPSHADQYDLCCNDDRDPLLSYGWGKILKLEFDIAKPRTALAQPIHIPFSVHDYIYRACFHRRDELLRNPKTIRLLFAGAYVGYEHGPIGSRLGKLERKEIVDIYRACEHTRVIASKADLDAMLAAPPTATYYWVDTSRYRIPPEQWLDVLSRVEVFLCPPGVVTPMSYNAVEAVAMGAIPLINYPEWFHPRLVDGKDCFSFTDRGSLLQQLDSIQHLADAELCRMRQHALAYYDQFLKLESVVERIDQRDGDLVNLVFDVEQAECTGRIEQDSLAISED